MKLARVVVTVAVLVAAGGCHRSTSRLAMPAREVSPQMKEVSGRIFQLEYDAPRTPLNQWRYKGLIDDYHVMDYYGIGSGSEAEYRRSIRTHKANLPKDFPTRPQPAVKTILSKEDEQYLQKLPGEILREKQMSGETAVDW